MGDRITNAMLAKLFSVEFLVSAVIATFVLGTLWSSVNSEIAEAQQNAQQSAEKVAAVETAVNIIKTDVAVIKANQINAAATDKEQSKELAEQRKDIKAILQLLSRVKGEL